MVYTDEVTPVEALRRYAHLVAHKGELEELLLVTTAKLAKLNEELATISDQDISDCATFLTAEVQEARGG